jgi:signal transduction histidine kinase
VRGTTGSPEQQLDRDFPVTIATMPATTPQRRFAAGVVVALVAVAAAVAPFASIQVGQVDAFIPVVQTVLSAADLVTAILLFVQYSFQPQPALLALGSGYLFSASFAFLQTLSFPNGYAPAGLIGDATNTPAWFFVYWRFSFPATVLAYALLKDHPGEAAPSDRAVRVRIGVTVLCVLALIAALTVIVTTFARYVPNLFYRGSVTQPTRLVSQINIVLLLWYVAVLLVLFPRRRTVLDLWLMVTLVAWMPDSFVASAGGSTRFTVGWYAARGFALIASCMLLCVFLAEMTALYARLASAFSLLRRERANRLMTVDAATSAIAHEVRTPLAAIALNASSALGQLRGASTDLAEIEAILKEIERDSLRADEIIRTVRGLFRNSGDSRRVASLDDLTRQALSLAQHDLVANGVSVSTEFQCQLAQVRIDPALMQHVILNLVRNAIDAMISVAPRDRELHLTTRRGRGSTVVLSVRDAGNGIAAEDRDRIFEPFFTTKPSGMGLGLAISRAIVENQGGKLSLGAVNFNGAIFEVTLPIAS